MTYLNLVRNYFTTYCTLGTLTEPQTGKTWDTMERPWIPSSLTVAGVKGYSCVGLGTYRLERYSSDAHPNVYALSNPALDVCITETEVPPTKIGIARTRVLIHPANWASELRGCVAPGKSRVRGPGNLWMVTRSRDAMNEVRNAIARSVDITLSVTSMGG